ncbi:MAG: hypothetical protein H3C30_15845 [Candidatus Hydrogenedentes bacterium]|nr:hypothetical protein [Candidatus Hydrogenedentota bacterium]
MFNQFAKYETAFRDWWRDEWHGTALTPLEEDQPKHPRLGRVPRPVLRERGGS